MIDKVISFLKGILSKTQKEIDININNSKVVINGEIISDEITILGEKLKVDKDFKVEVYYFGSVNEISTVNGNIKAHLVNNTNISTVKSSNGDIEINCDNISEIKEIKNSNGEVKITGNVSQVGSVKTTNGNVKIKTCE